MQFTDSATAKMSTTISTITLCSCKYVDFYQKNIRNRHIVIQLKDRENENLRNVFNTAFIYTVLSPRKRTPNIIPVKCFKKFKKKANAIWHNKPLSRRYFHLNDSQQTDVINKKILERNEWFIFHISVIFRNECYQLARI